MSNFENFNEAGGQAPLPFNENEVPLSPLSPQASDIELETDPTLFGDWAYEDLPEPLNSAVECGKNEEDKMLLLIGSIVVLSSTITKNVRFYYQKQYRPNLLAFIFAPPASGKGRVALCILLVIEIHEELMATTKQQLRAYRKDLDVRSKAGQRGDSLPERPKMRMLLFPANSTVAALDNLISDNDGCGLLFTPDGGNMMSIIQSEHGNYVNDLLATAENEPLSRARKMDLELIEVPETRFSVLVASTFSQIFNLFGDGSDGLHSRPLYFIIRKNRIWETQWKNEGEVPDDEIFRRLGKDFKKLHEKLLQSGEVEFVLNNDQKKRFDLKFEDLANSFVNLYGDRFLPSVKRMAVTALRIMCVLTILEELNKPVDMPEKVMCSEKNFERVLKMVETLLVHSGYSFSTLPAPVNKFKIKIDGWNALMKALPDRFQRSEAVKIGNRLGFKTKRIDKYLERLCNENSLCRVEHGVYMKV